MSVFVGKRDVVTVSGEEAKSFLQGQISQDVEQLSGGAGASAWSLILQPQGKVDAWFRITSTNEENSYLLDVDAGYGEALLVRLNRFKLRTKAEFGLETWDWHEFVGEASDQMSVSADAGVFVVAGISPTSYGVIGATLAPPNLEPVDRAEFERLRILNRVPAMGAELTEDTIPAEAGIVDVSVSFTKGCYTGQELVARVDSRGNNTPKRLALISGPGAASVGEELTIDGAVVATLTSVADDPDGFVALGYVKRSAFDATTATLGDRTVNVDLPS